MNEGRKVRGPSSFPSPQVKVTTPRLSGLILAMLVAVLLAGRILWLIQHREDQDTPPFLVLLLLGESPLLIAGILILTRKVESVARGAGLACAAALAYILLAIPLFLDTMISSGWNPGYHKVDALEKFIPVSVAGAIWVLVAALPERLRNRAGFWRYFATGIAYVIPALFIVSSTAVRASRYSNERASLVSPFQGAIPPVRQLSACLIRQQFLHPQHQYPNSLEGIGPDWNCDEALGDRRSFFPYWISYSSEKHSDGAPDFRIVAVPEGPLQ